MSAQQLAVAMLSLDHVLQAITIAAAVLGVGCSYYGMLTTLDVWQEMRRNRINSYRLSGVRMLLKQEAKLLAVQIILGTISLLVVTLPDVPVVMYTGNASGPWILFVLVLRKLGRLGMSLLVLSISYDRMRWLITVPRDA